MQTGTTTVENSLVILQEAKHGITVFVCESLSRAWLCNPGTVAHQAPLSTGLSRQEDWSG